MTLPRIVLISLLLATSAVSARPVVHIVLLWLQQPGNSEQRQQLIAASKTLRTIPGIQRLQLGETLPGERSIVDDSFDIALVFTFEDAASLRAYLTHPQHRRVVEQDIKPLVSRIRVHDFVDVMGD